MRLKHRAPVVHIQVLDQHMQPIPSESGGGGGTLPIPGSSNNNASLNNPEANHKVVICSEEQFKVFQLPTLKPVCKYKLTASEGARVRRIGYSLFESRAGDPRILEFCLLCLSNIGDVSIFSLPQLKRQVQQQCMKQQDINAITSFVYSKLGQAFYLQSPSEFVQISFSARDTPNQQNLLILKDTAAAVSSSSKEAAKSTSVSKQQASSKKASKPAESSQQPKNQQQQQQQQSSETNLNGTNNTASAAPPVPAPRSLAQISADQANLR